MLGICSYGFKVPLIALFRGEKPADASFDDKRKETFMSIWLLWVLWMREVKAREYKWLSQILNTAEADTGTHEVRPRWP